MGDILDLVGRFERWPRREARRGGHARAAAAPDTILCTNKRRSYVLVVHALMQRRSKCSAAGSEVHTRVGRVVYNSVHVFQRVEFAIRHA